MEILSKPTKQISEIEMAVIFIPDGDFKRFKFEISGLGKEVEYNLTRLWNSDSPFVMAGANKYQKLQQTAIFDHFS
jgi:hypothetical protein